MTLEDFAKDAGCIVYEMDDHEYWWGGKYAYKTIDHPNSSVCGFKTEAQAYKRFLEDSFGVTPTKALIKLFKKVKSCQLKK